MNRKQILLILSLALTGMTGAQEKLVLDLDAAREYALNYNRTLKNSDLAVSHSEQKLREAIASGLPQVNATTDYSNAMGAEISIQFDENLPPSKIPIKPTSNFNLQVGQMIFNGSYFVGVQSAKLFQKLSEKNKVKTENDIVSQVTETWYLVLVSRESLDILKGNMQNLNDLYKKTEPVVRVGMMEKVELDQLLVQVNSLQNAIRSAERQLEMTRNLLRLQLGVPAETEVELTGTLAEMLQTANAVSGVAETFDILRNPDYQVFSIQEQMTQKQIDMQKSAYLPTVSGFYSFTKKILKPAFDMSPAHMVGLQMNIPVFSSGVRRSKVMQAKIDLETVKNSKALLEEQLAMQFSQLQFNLKSALENYETQKKNVEVSREVFQHLRNKYEQGMISGMELTTADNNHLQAESDHLMSMLEVLKAHNALQTLTGEILENNNE